MKFGLFNPERVTFFLSEQVTKDGRTIVTLMGVKDAIHMPLMWFDSALPNTIAVDQKNLTLCGFTHQAIGTLTQD